MISPVLVPAATLIAAAQIGGPLGIGLDVSVQSARADAAKLTGVPASSIELVSAEAVTWPDGSLGCPRPGMNYTMALVPGYRVKLRSDSKLLDYHLGASGAMVLCPASRSREPVPGNRS